MGFTPLTTWISCSATPICRATTCRAFDLERLLHYSFFTPQGLTIHDRGLSALVRFLAVRAELFHTIYFHRTVRAIDLALEDVFNASKPYLFPGNPLDHLDEYQRLTEWSLLVRVAAWPQSSTPVLVELGRRWQDFLAQDPLEDGLRADHLLPAGPV